MTLHMILAFSLVMVPFVSLAKTVPDPRPRLLLDRISAAAAQTETTAISLELLERVALGRTGEIMPESAAQVGVDVVQLQQKGFSDSSVRAYALRKIAETGLPEALEFLRNLKQGDLGPDTTQQIWPSAQIAFRNALLNRIEDPQLKIEFLESAVAEHGGRGVASYWAVSRLCDDGALASLPIIQQSLRAGWSGQYGEDQIRFCEARMQVVSRYPDRVRALGSVLSVEDGTEDDRLVRWAIYQLVEMRTPSADAELNRFASEIGSLPVGSPLQTRLSTFKREIDDTSKASVK
jgi:hypothetical protein